MYADMRRLITCVSFGDDERIDDRGIFRLSVYFPVVTCVRIIIGRCCVLLVGKIERMQTDGGENWLAQRNPIFRDLLDNYPTRMPGVGHAN